MTLFWRTRKVASKIRMDLSHIFKFIVMDIIDAPIKMLQMLGLQSHMKDIAKKVGILRFYQKDPIKFEIQNKYVDKQSTDSTKPVIFISACENAKEHGGYKYNGGINEYNSLIKLLRNRGYEAYIVTYDGKYDEWLLDHQPHISIADFRRRIKSNPNVRCVTSWAISKAFIRECKKLYFWDMELLYTNSQHFSTISGLYRKKIVKTASISRTIQAWHMANFGKACTIIPNLLDTDKWKADETKRIFNRVGYMNEGKFTEHHIAILNDKAKAAGLDIDFFQIKGETKEVLNGMQSCNLFISMNQGKDALWGEGCPRTIIEAMSAGAVILAYDIIGNREMIHHSFNGLIVPRHRTDILSDTLINLYQEPSEIIRLRENGQNIIQSCHTFEARWPAIKEFLEL